MPRAYRTLVSAVCATAVLVGLGSLAGAGGGCGPLPGDRDGAAAPPQDIVTVHTGDGRYFYLVDTRRALCFFGDRYRPQLTKVPCEDVPEAYELLGWDPTPEDGEAFDDGSDAVEPLRPPDDTSQPDGDAEPPPPERADPGPPPTPEERQAFEQAFVERFCASRQPTDAEAGPPDEEAIARRHGLTPERYEQVRDHLAADAAAWRALSEQALAACP